ncbi:ComEC/Rec2 family competence protein [Candidatus Similichlamydia epinepheli]|uniref:ComEC/Rec2 family competence protein n=1 Tax=Candidatus Similichlamydia epinepheli TaxID=1903953 RepID=UPI000D3794FF|nr:ComEC/Rec2 family competence protein [Candidatus Similichlamydia epinepheli]
MPTLSQFRDAYFFWAGLTIVFCLTSIQIDSPTEFSVHVGICLITFSLLIKSLNFFLTKNTKFVFLLLFSFVTFHHCLLVIQSHKEHQKKIHYFEKESSTFLFLLREARLSQRKHFWILEGWACSLDQKQKERFWLKISLPSNKLLASDPFLGSWRITGLFYKSFFNQIQVKSNTLQFFPHPQTMTKSIVNRFISTWAVSRCLMMQKIESHIQKICPNQFTSKFIQTLLFGREPEYKIKRLFVLAGLSHLLIVSGLHFSCVINTINIIFKRIRTGSVKFSLQLMLYLAYFFIIGPRPPAFRAFLSSLLASISSFLPNSTNPYQSYGIVLTVSACIDPFSVLTFSYGLSYIAVGALLICSEFNYQKSKDSLPYRYINCMEMKLSQNLAICLALLPLQLSFSKELPILSPILGLIFNDSISMLIKISAILVISSCFIPIALSKSFFCLLGHFLKMIIELLWKLELNTCQLKIPCVLQTNSMLISKMFLSCFLFMKWRSWEDKNDSIFSHTCLTQSVPTHKMSPLVEKQNRKEQL